ncbi:putative inactive leucine-rich repeat receptor-like protein kinase [Quercus suber]|uniref:Inactive leucine-rich repeat receptor-like protein kinase n=1 Tax=Quercus suber TaxID=58331 RepID=A0AAW0JDL9_QUESU
MKAQAVHEKGRKQDMDVIMDIKHMFVQEHTQQIVNVSSNYFSGDIPVQLSSLKNLQTIILDNNKFTGRVPGWLSTLQFCLY